MKREPGFLHILARLMLVLVVLYLSWTAAYFITAAIYSRMSWAFHDLFVFLINATLGFFFFGIFSMTVRRFIQPREQHAFTEMIDALKRISQGDFHINLDWDLGGRNGKHRRPHPYVQLVDSINDMAANLKAMEKLREEFISNVSHEIGSPLTSIIGFAKALKDENLDREQRDRYLSIIETECIRLSKLSDNLMKLAILDSERHPFRPSLYRLDKQLISLILACEPQWEAKKIEMTVEVDIVEVNADEDLMGQVWVNLLHNAIKFTPQGGSISVSLSSNGDQAVICIADTGQGINEQDQQRIFERFYKADQSRARTAGGSGLGLSIAYKITEMHTGSISVSSKVGEGTVFTVMLPLRQKVMKGSSNCEMYNGTVI
ncbi:MULTISPECIES: sensor histidine kinase [Paenibacillus]|uniref:sensor histidine kinase n=1 Tax=Paenibacillus TaxID=44249 RepID=UPI0003D36284|nr:MULTISPECIES: HAMP domain-containing sensor histidine kinase [Paenibacillus]AHC19776.1 membrane protein [Paenibacillus polymyxa CR1]APB76243.1 sensor histidine kinase [Paenibacillus polymyxa]OMF74820.1 two-component sensor histidine kinase [Paenibacillus peoriae]OMF81964.1 two-component sensor histidine kinase [Paenibacillus peoriae]POR26238.1 sensor histidine kinase [Paenibacillus polymyxa]